MHRDFWLFLGLISLCGLIGALFGYGLQAALLTSIFILGWQSNALQHLNRWLIQPSKKPLAREHGQIYGLYRQLLRKNQQNRQRKKRLNSLISEFRTAVSALPDAIVLVNDLRKITWANPNAKTLLGIDWPLDNGVRFDDLIRDPSVKQLFLRDQNSATTSNQGLEIKSPKNHEQTISLKCVRYSQSTRMIIARDVSRLMKVNQIHSDFVANVSHELKTPLTVLKGYIEIINDNNAIAPQFETALEQMSVQSTRMQLIVNDLLYLAKLENKDSLSAPEPVVVSHIINAIVEALRPLIDEKNQKLVLEIDETLAIVGSVNELHSAFTNLVSNAIHYTPEGGNIKLSWAYKRERKRAELAVIDDGEGIAAHHLKRLTQRFYRVDSDRSRAGGGTGLGLAIVKHVLQRHQATLDIRSKVGEGSAFICRFPLAQLTGAQTSNVVTLATAIRAPESETG